MAVCFVIQPFDRDRYDKRYEDTFRPAIEAAGLEPYRVDHDPSVAVPIQEIENGIRRADIAFAEISTNNPNVWFELGFAIAAGKPVVMVCAEDRETFPFDVQHRTIVRYKSDAPSDFARLGADITARLKAAVERQLELKNIADLSPVADQEGLSQHEVAALTTISSYNAVPGDPPSFWSVQQDMNRAGFTNIAVTLSTRSLLRKGLVQETMGFDENSGVEFEAVEVTDQGLRWLEANQDRLVLKRKPKDEADDGLPF